MMFEQCKIVIFNNIIFMKKHRKIFRKNSMEIFRKNMKFSGQIFRLTSLRGSNSFNQFSVSLYLFSRTLFPASKELSA